MSQTELKMQPTIHLELKGGLRVSAFEMYRGLHFQFRRDHYYYVEIQLAKQYD
jgi:hypothetical protein